MKIINLCFSDTAGSAYSLSHAINKCTKHQSINLRSTSNYIQYPTIAEMRHYDVPKCQKMIYGSDVVIFHTAIRPFYQGLELDPRQLEDAKKLLYFHGSDLRFMGKTLLEQADQYIGNYQIVVSTPDLLLYAPKGAEWLPVTRSFGEIRRRYAPCNQDVKALDSYATPKKKVVFCHAPTDEDKKGSSLFYRVITKIVKNHENVEFRTIRNQTWYACLRQLSDVDVYFDQNPPFLGSYGTLAVEASIFRIPTVTKLSREAIDVIKKLTGMDSPFVTFADERELSARALLLAENEKVRRKLGNIAYRFCKAFHDEKPVTKRLLKIIAGMA